MTTNDADTNVQVSTIGVDAIEELKVNTTGYRAEYGRNAGATVSIVSKSGTNQFRGGYSYYMRNEKLNANNYFNLQNNLPKPVFRYNTGSGNISTHVNHFQRSTMYTGRGSMSYTLSPVNTQKL